MNKVKVTTLNKNCIDIVDNKEDLISMLNLIGIEKEENDDSLSTDEIEQLFGE